MARRMAWGHAPGLQAAVWSVSAFLARPTQSLEQEWRLPLVTAFHHPAIFTLLLTARLGRILETIQLEG